MFVLGTFCVGVFMNGRKLQLRQTSVDIFGDSADTRPPVHQDNLNSVPRSKKHS